MCSSTTNLIDISDPDDNTDDDGSFVNSFQANNKRDRTRFSTADNEQYDDDAAEDNDEDDQIVIPKYKSRWNLGSSAGGTVLNDPLLQTDFNVEYRIWSLYSKKNKINSKTASVIDDRNSSIFSAALGASSHSPRHEKKYSKLTERLLPSSVSSNESESFISSILSPKRASKMSANSKNSDSWLSTPPASSQKAYHLVPNSGTNNETQRLVEPPSSVGTASLLAEHQRYHSNLFNNVACQDDDDDDDEDGDDNGNDDRFINSSTSALSGEQLCDWGLYKGIFYSSLSSVFFSLSAVIVKYLKNIHPGELAVCRFFGIFVLTIPMIVYHDLNPFGPPELRHLLIMRGIAGATSLFLRFFAFRYLPIADASVIIFSIPVFVSIFAWLFLKEPCGAFQIVTISIAMIGLLMTTKLPFLFGDADSSLVYPNYLDQTTGFVAKNITSIISKNSSMPVTMTVEDEKLNHFYGVVSGLSSLIFASAVFIFIRKAKGAHHAVIMFNFGWVAIIETTILTTFLNGFSLPRSQFEWYLIVILSIFSFCGQILLTRALQLEQAGPVSLVRATTDIALAFLWQLFIFKETPDFWSILGALLVCTCIVLISLRKWVNSLPGHSKLKTKLYFLNM